MSAVDQETVSKWIRLVILLDRLTDIKKIKWDQGPNQNSFVTAVGKETIEIRTEVRELDEQMDIFVQIYDQYGETIDTFGDEDISVSFHHPTSTPAFIFMRELHRKIARKVSGADDMLTSILSELEKEDDNPF